MTARAGKDLVSCLVSGLLTIGPRFGGAVDDAARYFQDACDRGEDFAAASWRTAWHTAVQRHMLYVPYMTDIMTYLKKHGNRGGDFTTGAMFWCVKLYTAACLLHAWLTADIMTASRTCVTRVAVLVSYAPCCAVLWCAVSVCMYTPQIAPVACSTDGVHYVWVQMHTNLAHIMS